jgi:hypothetical protein
MRRCVPLLPLALLGLLLAACTADPLNVVVLSARAPGEKCQFDDNTKYVEDGSIDFRPYAVGGGVAYTGSYGQVFGWENNLQKVETTVNGQPVDNGTGNNFVADSVVYEYQYSDPNVVMPTNETQNIHAVITAGASADNNTVGIALVPPLASAAVLAGGLDSTEKTLRVTFQIFGKLVAGTSKYSNKVSFPIYVYQSDPTVLDCPSQGLVLNGGVCGIPGRDQDVSCKKP